MIYFLLIEDLILSKMSLDACLEIMIFEFNNDDVFSNIILSIVRSFFGNQSKMI